MIKILLLCLFTFSILHAQDNFYIPADIKNLYEKGTRSLDGNPGKNYWQNSADYFIRAELIPEQKKISGEEKIIYRNNSPYILDQIVIHLFPDLYKKGTKRDSRISEKDLTDGVVISFIKYNGVDINIDGQVTRIGTNLFLNRLPHFVSPGTVCTLEIKWSFTLPSVTRIRMGAYKDSSFFVAYWFPKIAVYDDLDGWNTKIYSGKTEFYSDYGNYDVQVTLPSDFFVWATGELQNENEVYPEEILYKLQKAKESEEAINIITSEDYKKLNFNNKKQTWKFFAENVPDFSFAAAKNHLWDGVSSIIDGRKVFIDAAYPADASFYNEAAKLSKISIDYFSNIFPGIPYPFPKFTTFCNGRESYGGMETPMMANNNSPDDRGRLLSLISHEIFHTYFPFLVGINEIKYAWMEEGWASYFPSELFPKYDSTFNQFYDRKSKYYTAGTEYDVPPVLPTHLLESPALYSVSYIRSLFAYHSLRKLLGDELFKKALLNYVDSWKYKHPLPYDFFFSFNKSAGEDLTWFWNPWFFEFAFVDIGLRKEKDKLIIEKIGKIPVHVLVKIRYKNGSEKIIEKGVRFWKENSSFQININEDDIYSAELITDEIPDTNPENDIIIF